MSEPIHSDGDCERCADARKEQKPLFKHDCTNCIFLGTERGADLYGCPQSSGGDVIARFSSEGADYASSMISIVERHMLANPLTEDVRLLSIAYKRFMERPEGQRSRRRQAVKTLVFTLGEMARQLDIDPGKWAASGEPSPLLDKEDYSSEASYHEALATACVGKALQDLAIKDVLPDETYDGTAAIIRGAIKTLSE